MLFTFIVISANDGKSFNSIALFISSTLFGTMLESLYCINELVRIVCCIPFVLLTSFVPALTYKHKVGKIKAHS